jgi:hypothetical protein
MTALRAFLASNAEQGLALPGAASFLPTVSWADALSISAPLTSLPNGINIAATDSRISHALAGQTVTGLPGNPSVNGFPCLGVDRAYSCKGEARLVGSVHWLRFRTDAQVVELAGVVTDGSYTAQTLIVDGKLVPPTVLSSYRTGSRGGWNSAAIRIAFADRRMRDVWIESGLHVGYVRIGPNDSLESSNDVMEPQISVVGDSYLQSLSASFGNGGAIALEVAARLGIRKIVTDAIGGTGYWNSGSGTGNLKDRLPAHGTDNSQIYLIMSGLNDYGDVISSSTLVWPSRAEYEDGVRSYLQGLRSAQPTALIVVTAPFSPVPPMSDSTYVSNPGTNTSALGDSLYKASLLKECIGNIKGPWVYVDVLMGGGWLNSSGAVGDVTGLQWFTGGTAGPGTSATYKPGNTVGGGGGGFGGIASVPVLAGGLYSQGPEVTATGGNGTGLLLSSTISASGVLTAINIVQPGSGYTQSLLPTIHIDRRFEQSPAQLGAPTLIQGVNPSGQYPLLSFAPPGVAPSDLNNIYVMLSADTVHPSPVGVPYLSARIARNIYDALMAL